MGQNNRARRAAKSKAKAKARSGGPPGQAGSPGSRSGTTGGGHASAWSSPPPEDPWFDDAEVVREVLNETAWAKATGNPSYRRGIDTLASAPLVLSCTAVEGLLLQGIAGQWRNGWQPAELQRQGRRATSAAGGRLVALAIATDDASRRATTLDPRWRAQLDALELPRVSGRPGWAERWTQEEQLAARAAIVAMIDVVADILSLPPLDVILPPPGSTAASRAATRRSTAVGAESDPILDRIRNLLAKAESTTFEAEATALTAKAQQLMTRHAIDAALVEDRNEGGSYEAPVMVRVPIEAPYVDAKSLLLQTVAGASRCRSVFHGRVDLSTVVGFTGDVAATELLFTSLLIQAQSALADAAKHAPPGTRVRSQSYRSAFLLAYTDRIGDRLREINESVFAEVEAEQGGAFLPVLRSRTEAVDDFVSEQFGELQSSRVRGGYDAAGWASGRLAADQAELASGHLPEGAAAG
jgi:hypothetical protein